MTDLPPPERRMVMYETERTEETEVIDIEMIGTGV